MSSPGAIARFFGGMGAARRGAMMLVDRPRLWVWLVVPLVVNFFVVILLGGMLITFLSKWGDTLHRHFAGADGKQSWWLWSLEWLAFVAAAGVALLAMVLIWKVLELILFGVAYARITESVEREQLKPGESLRPLTMLQDFLDAIFNAAILITGFFILFVLSFIPGVAIFSVFFGVLWGGFVQGLDLLGVCRALRGDRRWKQIAFCLENMADTLGLGLIGFAFSFIPILGPVLVVSCAVGAVLVHGEINKRRSVP